MEQRAPRQRDHPSATECARRTAVRPPRAFHETGAVLHPRINPYRGSSLFSSRWRDTMMRNTV